MNTKAKIRAISIILFAAVAAVWAVFYAIISNYIADATESQISLAAEQVIERLGGEFSQAESLSYSLVNSADVRTLAMQRNDRLFYSLAEKLSMSPSGSAYSSDFVEDILLRCGDDGYYRIAGKLGNKSCALLNDLIPTLSLPTYLNVELEGVKYIGYADKLAGYDTGRAGAVVTLIEEEKILEVMQSYDQSGALLIKIEGVDGVVTANTDQLDLFYNSRAPIITSRLDITPYEISVTAEPQYMRDSLASFTLVAIITAAIFGLVLLLYSDTLNKQFFRPMVKVIGGIEALNAETPAENLPHVQSQEFDGLVDKINELLQHIEEKNNALLAAEVERQIALMLSLKKQINAHFTVNTLNTIRILARNGETKKAEAIAEGLLSLFRYAYDKDEKINVWDEYGVLQTYVDIMNNRYDGKLNVDFDFDTRLMDEDYRMPRMLLQPIIENAIAYGYQEPVSHFAISVKAGLSDGFLSFTVSDNGRGMSAEALAALMERLDVDADSARGVESIALRNICNRLYHYYGDAGQLTIKQGSGGGLVVSVTIPATLANEEGGMV
ncbi:MAG: histidine kinase [Oscillospiraceae bacterium]|jgi:sensor histidine kinase YesM|nr:histidine kinase [Oscillospiraceae bacterium]